MLNDEVKTLNHQSVAKPNFLTSLLNSVDNPKELMSRMVSYKAQPSTNNPTSRLPEIGI
jgi:hypothetical protein